MIKSFESDKYWGLRIALQMQRRMFGLCGWLSESQAVAVVDVQLPCDSSLSSDGIQVLLKENLTMDPQDKIKSYFKMKTSPQVSSCTK